MGPDPSAIWHGALLDPDRWPGWLTNLPGQHDGIFSWFDLPAVGSAGPARWFVDPMSRLLLDRWVERSATPADLPSPWLCLLACVRHAVAMEDRAEAAARFDVPRNILDRWLAARDTLLSPSASGVPFEERCDRSRRGPPQMASRTIRDRTRQDAITNRWRDNFPRVPSDREADLIDPLWKRAIRAPYYQVAPGIWVFAHRYDARRNVIIARGWEEAGDVQRLLGILGVKAPVVHHPGRGCSRAQIATVRTPRPPRGIGRKDQFFIRSGQLGGR